MDETIRSDHRTNLKWFAYRKRWAILFLILSVFISYFNTLGNGYVSDDRDLPRDYQRQDYLTRIFSPAVSYRVPLLTHYLDSLGGLAPWRSHLTNILLHAFAVLLVYYFLYQLLTARWAFFSSLLFAVHPIHTDAVSWIVARSYILFSIFILISLLLYVRSTQGKAIRKSFYFFSLLNYLLAFESRWAEPVFFPILLIIYNLSFRSLREKWKTTLPYFFIAGIYPLLMLKVIQNRVVETSTGPTGQLELNNPLLHVPVALFTYLKLFLAPLDLTFYHEDLGSGPLIYILSILTVITLIASLIYFYRKNKILFFFLSLFLLSLIHTFSPLKIAWAIAERYVYLGSIGLSVIFTYAFIYLTKNKRLKTTLFIIFINFLVLYSARTITRNLDWKNEDSLWLATIKTSPTSSKALNNIGDYYGRHGDPQKSFESFVKATQINPTYSDAWHNAGNVLLQNGKYEQSIPYFEKSVQFNPNLIEGYNNLAIAYSKLGNGEKAHELIEKSLATNPDAIKTYNALAQIEYESGDIEKSKEAILRGLRVDPKNATLKEILNLLQKQKQPPPL